MPSILSSNRFFHITDSFIKDVKYIMHKDKTHVIWDSLHIITLICFIKRGGLGSYNKLKLAIFYWSSCTWPGEWTNMSNRSIHFPTVSKTCQLEFLYQYHCFTRKSLRSYVRRNKHEHGQSSIFSILCYIASWYLSSKP